MELFAGTGPATAACGDEGGQDRRFPDPPRHDLNTMLVIRDALLSQLQKDRLRQEIILAELAKIERAMALRAADAERAASPGVPFSFLEEMAHGGEAVGRADHGVVAAGVDNDLKKKKDGVSGDGELDSQKPATEDLALKTSCGAGNSAGQQNAAVDESKLQEPNEATLPKKTMPSSVKWSCDICRVEAPTEGHLQQHFAGRKHWSKVATLDNDVKQKKKDGMHRGVELESQKPAMEDLVRDRECLKTSCGAGNAPGQRNAALDGSKLQEPNETTAPSSVKWSCDICRVGAPTEGHLQQHFAGQKHRSKVATLVSRNKTNSQKAKAPAAKSENVWQYDEKPHQTWVCRFCQSNCTCKSDLENHLRGKRHKAKIQSLLEECKNMAVNYGSLNSQATIVTQDEDNNPALTWNCNLCQAKCTCQSNLANHLRGKRHKLNFLILQVEGKQYLTEWFCGICEAKCNSVSQFENHCSTRGHQQKVEALRGGGQIASSSGFKIAKGASSEETVIHRATYFCKLCNLHCNSKNTLAEHRKGKNHTEKVEKRMSLSFCQVCNLQCNSEKMLAHHRTGKAHLAKLNNC